MSLRTHDGVAAALISVLGGNPDFFVMYVCKTCLSECGSSEIAIKDVLDVRGYPPRLRQVAWTPFSRFGTISSNERNSLVLRVSY